MSARILVIDNYDSFTFNLVQALRELEAETLVYRNDELEVDAALALEPTHLLISPGPGTPEKAGSSLAMIGAFFQRVPILGVCLGHQALAAHLGAEVGRAESPIHGKAERVFHDGRGLYRGLPNPVEVGRYHSLVVSEEGLPDELAVASYTRAGEIMGIRHKVLPHEGLQFHPESVLTPQGNRMLERFLQRSPADVQRALEKTARTPKETPA